MNKGFEFGKNWQKYSDKFLNYEKIAEAKASLKKTLGLDNLSGKSFIDVGCGSGIFSIAAARLGAEKIVGFDIDPIAVKTAQENVKRFLGEKQISVEIIQKSALDSNLKDELGIFDVVYAWGSLHHTGNMHKAIKAASQMVKDKGIFCLAIYNKDITSPIWLRIKRFYNIAPYPIKILMILLFIVIIYTAKLIYTRKNPLKKERGMSFFYDVVDWLGGYPYEYASKDEIINYVQSKDFMLKNFFSPPAPTGCNTFVFERTSSRK